MHDSTPKHAIALNRFIETNPLKITTHLQIADCCCKDTRWTVRRLNQAISFFSWIPSGFENSKLETRRWGSQTL